MKHYTGTKIIQAEPMTLQQAIEAGLIRENSKQQLLDNHVTDGYHTHYPDGYDLWSPKETFESAYHLSETFIDRLQIEVNELIPRISKLQSFIRGERFQDLDFDDQELLRAQLNIMCAYINILYVRIRRVQK